MTNSVAERFELGSVLLVNELRLMVVQNVQAKTYSLVDLDNGVTYSTAHSVTELVAPIIESNQKYKVVNFVKSVRDVQEYDIIKVSGTYFVVTNVLFDLNKDELVYQVTDLENQIKDGLVWHKDVQEIYKQIRKRKKDYICI